MALEPLTPLLVDTIAPSTAIAGIIAVVLLVILLLDLSGQKGAARRKCTGILRWVSRRGLLLMFLVSLSATLGSLFFSEVAFWVPCKLCWLQRIFIYPQAFILGLALYKKDESVVPYVLLLSLVGMAVAGFHYGEQLRSIIDPANFDPNVPCDLTGISCRATYVLLYGFITIPFMSLVLLSLNAVISLVMLRCGRR